MHHSKKMGYGLVGCGYVCERHLSAIQSLPDASLVAVCDSDGKRAQAMADQFKVSSVETDYEKLLKRPDIDVVVLLLPTHLHEVFTVKAAEHGKHVFVEKPIAHSLEEAENMIQACEQAGVKLCVGHSHRYYPLSVEARQIVAEGKLGPIHKAKAFNFSFHRFDETRSWKTDPAYAFNGLLDIGIHYADNLRYILGREASRVCGNIRKVRTHRSPVMDEGTALLEFDGNIAVVFEVSLSQRMNAYPFGSGEGLEIFGENGSLHFSVTAGMVRGYWVDREGQETRLNETNDPDWDSIWRNLHHDFLASILDEKVPVPITGEDGYKALEIMNAIFQSSREERSIEIHAHANEEVHAV